MAKIRYHHLSEGERHQIYALREQGLSIRAIAKQLERSASTISRELRRNKRSDGAYDPEEASKMALRHRGAASQRPYKVFPDVWASSICPLLREGWSPDQAAGWLRTQEKGVSVSPRWIYQLIAEDRIRGGDLYKCLRRKGKKRRKKTDAGRSRIPNRVGIESRPAIVDEKSRVGDWEVDLIVGKQHKGYLLTLVKRKTKLLLMSQLANKQANTVRRAIIRLLKPYKRWVHTITADNGAEFAKHEGFAKQLGAAVYFADPYASWQRGLSEHTNGLVREYFPKGDRLTELKSSEVRLVQDRINLRPRKVLGYITPADAFVEACGLNR